MTVTTTLLVQKKMSQQPIRPHRQPPSIQSPIPHTPSDPGPVVPDPPSPAPTSSSSSASGRKRPTAEDYYRAFDRQLAVRYIQLVEGRRKRSQAVAAGQNPLMIPRMQIYAPPTSNQITALFELPGLSSNDISVNVTRDGKLTVTGERKAPPAFEDQERRATHFPVQEIKYGRFERSLTVPPGVESRHVTASLNEGILSLTWPRSAPTDTRSPNSPPVTSVQALIH